MSKEENVKTFTYQGIPLPVEGSIFSPSTLGHGDWFVPHEMRRHYGKELLDQVNQQYGTTTTFATGGYVQKPTVGRIVHYHNEVNPNPLAAIVTYVFKNPADGMCGLHVFGTEESDRNGVPFSETPKPGHWSWPPRD